jgi:hypothetical protein
MRLGELLEEARSLFASFPDLRTSELLTAEGGSMARGRSARGPGRTSSSTKRRSRRSMSPAQRKAVGERMRRYWAERRAAGKK